MNRFVKNVSDHGQPAMMSKMLAFIEAHRLLLGLMGSLVALGVAGVFFFIVPGEAGILSGWREIVLRYGHSVCWVLLAVAALLYAFRAPEAIVQVTGFSALVVYLVFLAVLVTTK